MLLAKVSGVEGLIGLLVLAGFLLTIFGTIGYGMLRLMLVEKWRP